ncbi:MAG: HNH endonuclease, partial [Acidiferrobacterales bacterium]
MHLLNQQILRTDISGMPLEWIDYRDAVRIYHLGQVAYACGNTLYKVYGGTNAATRKRSVIEVNSIIATSGESYSWLRNREKYLPPLNNKALFARDAFLCMYCGNHFLARDLSRDHIKP